MPTGYTATLMEQGQTFEDFVLGCARAFGAMLSMRDEPLDAPIPEAFQASTHYANELAKVRQQLAYLGALTPEQQLAAGEQLKVDAIKSAEDYANRCQAEDKRLLDMLEQVRAWEPPTEDHAKLKEFMLDQLAISLNGPYAANKLIDCKERPAIDYFQDAMRLAEESISYYQECHTQALERASSNTKWVQALRQSLKGGKP